MSEFERRDDLESAEGPPGWGGRLAAGAALSGLILAWLLVTPLAGLAFVGISAMRRLGGNERLRRVRRRG